MRIDLATASPETFEPFIGQDFTALKGEADVQLRLTSVELFERSGIRDKVVEIDGVTLPPRRAFALIFTSPAQAELAQGTFTLDHPELEELAIFLTVFRREGDTVYYESVFN